MEEPGEPSDFMPQFDADAGGELPVEMQEQIERDQFR